MPRARKPVEARLLEGSYQPSRHGPLPDPDDPAAPPAKPADLRGEAAKIWEQLSALLKPILRERDGPMLADMCRWRAELARVRKVLAKKSPGASGYNQLLIAAGICTDKFDKIASRFGLTPADRAKLRAEVAGRTEAAAKHLGPPKDLL